MGGVSLARVETLSKNIGLSSPYNLTENGESACVSKRTRIRVAVMRMPNLQTGLSSASRAVMNGISIAAAAPRRLLSNGISLCSKRHSSSRCCRRGRAVERRDSSNRLKYSWVKREYSVTRRGLTWERSQLDSTLAGFPVENFVLAELRKQAMWSEMRVELFHFRTNTDQEVDIVIESEAGEIVGIEVKASSSIGANDFKGLHALSQTVGRKFRRGVILYTGNESVPFGNDLYPLPVRSLW